MRRADGYYWIERVYIDADESDAFRRPEIIIRKRGVWIIDEDYHTRSDRWVHMLSGPLAPPTPERAANWRVGYDWLVAELKAAGDEEALWLTGPDDYLEGFYWIRAPGEAELIVGRFVYDSWLKMSPAYEGEGWANDAGVEIWGGPLTRIFRQVVGSRREWRFAVGEARYEGVGGTGF